MNEATHIRGRLIDHFYCKPGGRIHGNVSKKKEINHKFDWKPTNFTHFTHNCEKANNRLSYQNYRDIIKKKKGCYEKLPFKYDELADGVSDDEEVYLPN